MYQSLDPTFTQGSQLQKDFMGVDKMTFHFDLGKPFRPFEQLMGVLPEASKELVPPPYRVSVTFLLQTGVIFFITASYVRSRLPNPRFLPGNF